MRSGKDVSHPKEISPYLSHPPTTGAQGCPTGSPASANFWLNRKDTRTQPQTAWQYPRYRLQSQCL